MKLKPILPSAEIIKLGKRNDGAFVAPQTVKELPQFTKIDGAFNSYNKELRKKRFVNTPIQKSIYNFNFAGNGARGKMTHTKENVLKVAGSDKITKKPKIVLDIELDLEKIKEAEQYNFDGTELRGRRITNPEEAKEFIKKYGGVVKYNRGEHFKSGRFSGGLLRRTYEAETKRESAGGDVVEKEDEFKNLSEMVEESELKGKAKVKDEGM